MYLMPGIHHNQCCCGCWYRWQQTYDCVTGEWSAVTQESFQEVPSNPFGQDPDAWVKADDTGTVCTYYYVTDGPCDAWPSAPAANTDHSDCCTNYWFRWVQYYDCVTGEWSEVTQEGCDHAAANPFPQTPETWTKNSESGGACSYYYVAEGGVYDGTACDGHWPTAPAGQTAEPDDCCNVPCSDLHNASHTITVGISGNGFGTNDCHDANSVYNELDITYIWNATTQTGTVTAQAFTGAANPLVALFNLSCEGGNVSVSANQITCVYDAFNNGAGSGGHCTVTQTGPTTARVTISGVANCGCLGRDAPPDSFNIDVSNINAAHTFTTS